MSKKSVLERQLELLSAEESEKLLSTTDDMIDLITNRLPEAPHLQHYCTVLLFEFYRAKVMELSKLVGEGSDTLQ